MIDKSNTANRPTGEQNDIRVSAAGINRLPSLTPAIPAVEMAMSILGRYQAGPLPYPAAAFVLRDARPLTFIDARRRNTHLQLAPRLALSLAYRLIRRSERIEAGRRQLQPQETSPLAQQVASFMDNRPSAPDYGPFLAPAQREIRRAVHIESEDLRAPSSRPRRTGTIDDYQKNATSSAAKTVPVDVNRLTEQVIQNIDRRIVAQRERFGRL